MIAQCTAAALGNYIYHSKITTQLEEKKKKNDYKYKNKSKTVIFDTLVSENKVLCHPSSVDSLSTSAGTEDHVSMGGWSARKALKVVEHVEHGQHLNKQN